MLVLTRRSRDEGLPIAADKLLTRSGGQVAGTGKAAVQAVLRDHGIDRVLSEEGGRTSRGSVGRAQVYSELLISARLGEGDLEDIESFWVEQVRALWTRNPLVLRMDPAKSLRSNVADVLGQARARQAESPGATFMGTVLQHLVGAKIDLVVGCVEHHGASVADQQTGRAADFSVEDVAIHVTTSPGEAVIRRCEENLRRGLKPLLVTIGEGVAVAQGLANQAAIGDRIDIFEAEQLLAGNLYELGKFSREGRSATATQLVERYNAIIEAHENDPSLRIVLTG